MPGLAACAGKNNACRNRWDIFYITTDFSKSKTMR